MKLNRFIFALTILTGIIFLLPFGANAAPAIAAYQEIYRMNFEVLRQDGLPSGWFVTGDGYVVAQVRPNHWVYGRGAQFGPITPTEVAVGAVIPSSVPQLARVAISGGHDWIYSSKKFMAVADSGFDHMGVLDDELAYTPIAWKSNTPGFMVWLGDKWHKITPHNWQNTYRAFWSNHSFIIKTLREKRARWLPSDTETLADASREWGFLWHGLVSLRRLPMSGGRALYGDGSGSDGAGGVGLLGRPGSSDGGSEDGSHWQGGTGNGDSPNDPGQGGDPNWQ